MLYLDVLSVHMIRASEGSTIVYNHHTSESCTVSSELLHSRVRSSGQSPIWQNIFQSSKDPTFVLLLMLWHPLSAWDIALDALYQHFVSLVRCSAGFDYLN
jgi:hypothetical protein